MSGPIQLINGKTKTEIVKDTLIQLGFMTEKVPNGWLGRVKAVLRQKKIQVHETVIYQQRKRYITNMPKFVPQTATPVPAPVSAPNLFGTEDLMAKLTLADATKIKSFANDFGGLDALLEAVKAVKTVSV